MNMRSIRNTVSGILMSIFLATCSQEVERQIDDPTLPPVEESSETRDVQLMLKNKLNVGAPGTRSAEGGEQAAARNAASGSGVNATAGNNAGNAFGNNAGNSAAGNAAGNAAGDNAFGNATGNTRAATRGIASDAENTVSTLDVYVFGSPTENGTYTFQQRFAYRAEGFGEIPAGAERLQLLKGAEEDITNGILKVKKGLYVRLYAIANASGLVDPATDAAFADADFKPLVIDEDNADQPIRTAGVPALDEFLGFHTTLLNENDAAAGILTTPLAMSGSYGTPLDLTDRDVYTRLQAPMKLYRLAARFDIVNTEAASRLTIQNISMAKGRRGSYYYPITVYGDTPAQEDELITCTPRPFETLENANEGLTEGAFYSYPSPQTDEACLIISGLYRVNATESKPVSYRVPFVQKQPDGSSLHLDITYNHRYTVGITDADEYNLEVTFNVEDWQDSPLDGQDPENEIADFMVRDVLPAQSSSYEPETHTITMSVDTKEPECSFTAHTHSSIRLVATLDYPTSKDPATHWLKLETLEPDADYDYKSAFAAKYKVSLNKTYAGLNFPQAILRVSDAGGVAERIIIINPQPAPVALPTPAHTEDATNVLNRFDATTSTFYLYRVTDSSLPFHFTCNDGIIQPENTDWYTIERTGGTNVSPLFKFTLTNRDKVLPDNRHTLVFTNAKQEELKIEINVVLMETNLTDPKVDEGTSNATIDPAKNEIVLKLKNESGFKLGIDTYNGAKVMKVEYDKDPNGKTSDNWLTYNGTTFSGAPAYANSPATASHTTNNVTPAPVDNRSAILARASMGKPGKATASAVAALADNLPVYTDEAFAGFDAGTSPFTRAAAQLPKKKRTGIEFAVKADAKLKYFGKAHVTVKNECNGPDEVYTIEPEYQVPAVAPATPMAPTINNYDAANSTLYMVQQADGGVSKASVSIYSPGGSVLSLPAGTQGITLAPASGESDLQTQVYTVQWAGSNAKIPDEGIDLTVKNKSNLAKTYTVHIRKLASDITDMTLTAMPANTSSLDFANKKLSVNLAEGNALALTMKCYGGSVTVEKHPSFLQPAPESRALPVKGETTLRFTVSTDILAKKAEDLVLTNPSGGPKMTLSVTPVYIAPVVSGSKAMTPENVNKWEQADNTLYLVQQKDGKASKGVLTVYSLGGSKLTLPEGLKADLLSSDLKSQDYELSWAGSDELALTEQTKIIEFANKGDDSKKLSVNVRLVPNVITDFVLTPNSSGSASIDVPNRKVAVNVVEGNSFKLSMKAYAGAGQYVTATAPSWLKVSVPSNSRTAPVKGSTSLTFTLVNSAQKFPDGDIVLTNPSGGPAVTLKVSGTHVAPVVKAVNTFVPANASKWDEATQTLYLVQSAAGNNSSAKMTLYSLGGTTVEMPAGKPASLTVNTSATSEATKDFTFTWAGNSAADLTEQTFDVTLKNTDELTKTRVIHVKLMPNVIDDLAITQKGTADGSKSTFDNNTKTVTTDIASGNYFTLSMKAYGDATRVTVLSKPDWLNAEAPTTRAVPSKEATLIKFSINDQKTGFAEGNIVLKNPSGGPNLTIKVKPRYLAPVVSGSKTMTPANVNKWEKADNTLYLVQQKSGQVSKGILTVYSLGGSKLTLPAGITASLLVSDLNSQDYELSWAGSNELALTEQTKLIEFANKGDVTKKLSVNVRLVPNVITDFALTPKTTGSASLDAANRKVAINVAENNSFKLSMKAYGDAGKYVTATAPSWLQVSAPSETRTAPVKGNTSLTFTIVNSAQKFPTGNIVLTNPSGGPAVTLQVSGTHIAPVVKAVNTFVPANASKWDEASQTLYLVQSASGNNSSAKMTVYSLGGTTVEMTSGRPTSFTVNTSTTTETTKDFTFSWAGSDATNLSEQSFDIRLKNTDDIAKVRLVHVKLVPNIISDLAITQKGTADGSKSTLDTGTKTVTTDIASGNYFTLSMKAYGDATRVTVLSKPDWLNAEAPTTRAVPSKEATLIKFSVNDTKTSFAEGNIVLKNPSGGPNLTIKVKPRYMAPRHSKNPDGFSANSSYYSTAMNLVQRPSGQNSYGTAHIYSLGGSSAQFLTTKTGLSCSALGLATATTRDYPLTWTGSASALSDQTTTLRVWNLDKTLYLDIPIRLVANGILTASGPTWAAGPSSSGGVYVSGTVNVPIIKDKEVSIAVGSYGGTNAGTCPAWVTYTKVSESGTGSAYNAKATTSFKIKVKEQNGAYTEGDVVIRPASGGPSFNMRIKPVYQVPSISAASSPSPSQNNWDSGQNTIYLMQAPGGSSSTLNFTVYSLGGSRLSMVSAADASISFDKTTSTAYSTSYQIRWAGSNSVYNGNSIATRTLRISNYNDGTKYKDVTVKLIPNTVYDFKVTNAGNGVSLSGNTGTAATLTIPVIANNTFTLSMQCYNGAPTVTVPEWLVKTGGTTRSQPVRGTYNVTYKVNPDGTTFTTNKTMTISNPGGGPSLTVTLVPVFQKPTLASGGSSPVNSNNIVGGEMILYRTVDGYLSYNRLAITALGGCTVEVNGTNSAGVQLSQYANPQKNLYYYYTVGCPGKTADRHLNEVSSTVRVYNADRTQYTDIRARLLPSTPQFASYSESSEKSTKISVPSGFGTNTRDGMQTDIHFVDDPVNYGKSTLYFEVTSPTNFSIEVNSVGGKMSERATFSMYKSWNSSTKKAVISMTFIGNQWLKPGHNFWYLKVNSSEQAAFGQHLLDFYIDLPTANGVTAEKYNGNWYGLSVRNTFNKSNFTDSPSEPMARTNDWKHMTAEGYSTNIISLYKGIKDSGRYSVIGDIIRSENIYYYCTSSPPYRFWYVSNGYSEDSDQLMVPSNKTNPGRLIFYHPVSGGNWANGNDY